MSMRPGIRHGMACLVGAALPALIASAALASGPPATKGGRGASAPARVPAVRPAPAPAIPAAAPLAIGLMAFLDPETGELTGPIGAVVPPADVRPAAPQALPVELPGGGWMLDLRGAGQEFYVLHVDAFGRRTVTCVQDVRRARGPLPVPVAPAGQER